MTFQEIVYRYIGGNTATPNWPAHDLTQANVDELLSRHGKDRKAIQASGLYKKIRKTKSNTGGDGGADQKGDGGTDK